MNNAQRLIDELLEKAATQWGDEVANLIPSRICEKDFVDSQLELAALPSYEDRRNATLDDRWVELADRRPGDLEDHPHLVFCTQSAMLCGEWVRASAVNREYVAL